jgi:hypothetical protein
MEKQKMHGQYIRDTDRQHISEEDTFLWLSKGDLKAETESEIVAAQDQALNTKYYATKILHTETDSTRRLCQHLDDTIDHIISACPVLAKEQYVKRHDRVSAQIHFNIYKEIGVQLDKKHWYEHVPNSVVTNLYCGISKCKLTELSPITSLTLQSDTMKREHVC